MGSVCHQRSSDWLFNNIRVCYVDTQSETSQHAAYSPCDICYRIPSIYCITFAVPTPRLRSLCHYHILVIRNYECDAPKPFSQRLAIVSRKKFTYFNYVFRCYLKELKDIAFESNKESILARPSPVLH